MAISILDHYVRDFERHKNDAEEYIADGEFRKAESALSRMSSCQYELAVEADTMKEDIERLENELDEKEYEQEED